MPTTRRQRLLELEENKAAESLCALSVTKVDGSQTAVADDPLPKDDNQTKNESNAEKDETIEATDTFGMEPTKLKDDPTAAIDLFNMVCYTMTNAASQEDSETGDDNATTVTNDDNATDIGNGVVEENSPIDPVELDMLMKCIEPMQMKMLTKRDVMDPRKMKPIERAALHYASGRSQLRPMSVWETMMHMAMFCALSLRVSIRDVFLPPQKKTKKVHFEGEFPTAEIDITFSTEQMERLKKAHRYMETCFTKSVSGYMNVTELTFQRLKEHVFFTRKVFVMKAIKFQEMYKNNEYTFKQLSRMAAAAYNTGETYEVFYRRTLREWAKLRQDRLAVEKLETVKRRNRRIRYCHEAQLKLKRQLRERKEHVDYSDDRLTEEEVEERCDDLFNDTVKKLPPEILLPEEDFEKPKKPAKRKSSGAAELSDKQKKRKAEAAARRAEKEQLDELKRQEKIRAHSRNPPQHPKPDKPMLQCLYDARWSLYDPKELPPSQAMLIERLRPGMEGTKGLDWRQDADKLIGYYGFGVSGQGVYLFDESARSYHCEVDMLTRKLYGKDLDEKELYRTEWDEVADFARQKGLACVQYPATGFYNSDDFLKVCHSDSDEFQEYFDGLCLDVPNIVKAVREISGDLSPHYKKGEVDKENVRGTWHVDLGYMNQGYDHMMPAGTTEVTANCPEMCHMGLSKTGNHKFLYEAMGDLVDRMTLLMDEKFSKWKGQYYGDKARTPLFGDKFGRAMGAHFCRYEALTIGVTRVASTEEDTTLVQDVEAAVLRHNDGPNDDLPGYSHAMVYWVKVKDDDGTVWRVAFIFYSRKSIGDIMRRENETWGPVFNRIEEWDKQMIRRSLDNTTKETLQDCEDTYELGNIETVCYRCVPMADPMAYWSAMVDMMMRLKKIYSLGDSRMLELLYLGLKVSSSAQFVTVCRKWIDEPEWMLKDEMIQDDGVLCNLIRHFSDTAKSIPKKTGAQKNINALSYGNMHRFQPSENGDGLGSDEGDDVIVREQILKLRDTIIPAAEGTLKKADGDEYTFEDIIKEVKKLKAIGGVKSLGFYSLAVHTGILRSTKALKDSMRAEVAEDSAFVKYLLERNYFKTKKQAKVEGTKMVARFAKIRREGEYCVENLACKMGRAKFEHGYFLVPSEMYGDEDPFFEQEQRLLKEGNYPSSEEVEKKLKTYGDVFFPGQNIYCRKWTQPGRDNSDVVLMCRPLTGGEWVRQEFDDR